MVITLNICKICVHSHKSYIVYKSLCKVCLITFAYRENVHMSHLFIMFSQVQGKSLHISILYQSVVGIFGKFPNWHLYQSKFWLLIGKFVGYNQNFNFCPSCQSNLFLVTWFVLAIWEISPLAPILCSNLQVSCVAKWEISTISLTVWHVGYQSHGILGNFNIFPTKSVVS